MLQIPRVLDQVPISDISTGDVPAMVIAEIFRNVAGHKKRLAALVAPHSPLPNTWQVPRFLDDYKAADPTTAAYNTKMDSISTKLGEIQILFNDIFVLGGLDV